MLEATLDFDGNEYLLYAPFQTKDYLKNDGWRWSPERRAWHRESLYGFNVDISLAFTLQTQHGLRYTIYITTSFVA